MSPAPASSRTTSSAVSRAIERLADRLGDARGRADKAAEAADSDRRVVDDSPATSSTSSTVASANSSGCSQAARWSPATSRTSAPSACGQRALLARPDEMVAGGDQRAGRLAEVAGPRPGVVATQRLPGLHDADRIVAAHLATEPRHVHLQRVARAEQTADAVAQPALVGERSQQRPDDAHGLPAHTLER